MFAMSVFSTAMLFAVICSLFFEVKTNKGGPIAVFAFVGIPGYLFAMVLVFIFPSVVTLIASVVLISTAVSVPPKTTTTKYCLLAAIGVAAVYGWFSIAAFRAVRVQNEWLASHPFESMAERTASRRPVAPAPLMWKTAFAKDHSGWSGNNSELKNTLFADFENAIEFRGDSRITRRRANAIERLHHSSVERFMNSPGFGAVRTPAALVAPQRFVGSDEIPDIPQPELIRPADPATPEPLEAVPRDLPKETASENALRATAAASRSDLSSLHVSSMLDFLEPNDFGFARSVHEVSGFRPHHFKRPPEPPRGLVDLGPPYWKVERLELVGLLLHDAPVVYVSEKLPKMQSGRNAPTRPLDPFEQAALSLLELGAELTTQDVGNQLYVLGAIRATKECMKCHQVERGDLLGAFSYRLRRDPPMPTSKRVDDPKT